MGRRTILLIVAVLVAATGTALVFLYVQGVKQAAAAEQEMVEVLAATAPIQVGESMKAAQEAGKVDLIRVPKGSAVDGALSSAESLQNKVALGPIFPGEQIIPQKFGDPGNEQVLKLPKGKMAVSVQLSDPGRVAGFVKPGSEVTLFYSGTNADGDTFTRTLLERIEIVGVGHTTVLSLTKTTSEGEQTTEQIPTAIITLAASQDEAERIAYAAGNGELVLGLLTEQSATDASEGVTMDNLFEEVPQ